MVSGFHADSGESSWLRYFAGVASRRPGKYQVRREGISVLDRRDVPKSGDMSRVLLFKVSLPIR